jgi:hypothetical protein
MARPGISALLTLTLTAASVFAQSGVPPRTWVNKDTGHRVIRLTDEPGSSASTSTSMPTPRTTRPWSLPLRTAFTSWTWPPARPACSSPIRPALRTPGPEPDGTQSTPSSRAIRRICHARPLVYCTAVVRWVSRQPPGGTPINPTRRASSLRRNEDETFSEVVG